MVWLGRIKKYEIPNDKVSFFFFFFNLAYGMIGPDTSPTVCQKREDWHENFADISS